MIDWLLRLTKGAIIGVGFIVPGISGGALAAILGLYQRMISFVAHITKDFTKNAMFLAPVGIGGVLGIVVLAHPLSFLLENYEAQVIWGFIGCIIGTMPALWKEAGKEGREKKHYVTLVLTAVLGFIMLFALKPEPGASGGEALGPISAITWVFAGALMVFVAIVPGMSTSTFLIFFGLYLPMVNAVKAMDISVLLPIAIGAACSFFPLFKLIDLLLRKAFTGFFHFVVGIVIASTLMIVPMLDNYWSLTALSCAVTLVVGVVFGGWMGGLEERHKKQKL